MTIKELIDYGNKFIPRHQVEMLLEYYLKYDRVTIQNKLNEQVDEDIIDSYKKSIEKITNNYPIQYLLGNTNFYGYDFSVNANVLIPRFETEELVEHTIKYIEKYFSKDIKVIDLGTGSGCIGITLKKKIPTLNVTCLDISDDALVVAKHNAKSLGVDINFIQGNMLDNINEKFSIIISNPPYIGEDEKIEDVVRNYEPHLALFAKDDGLYFYDKILSMCRKNLEDKFLIAFEIGMTQKDRIISLANKYLGENIICEYKKDLSGKDRMIFIYKI